MSTSQDLQAARNEKRLQTIEGKLAHLHVRSELTMYVVSAMIGAGLVQREGVKELIEKADLSAFGTPSISEAERKIMLTLIDKVNVTQ